MRRLPWPAGGGLPPRAVAAAALAGACLLLMPLPVAGQERERRRPPDRGGQAGPDPAARLVDRFGERVADALGLGPEQTERLKTELQESRRERARLAERGRTLRRELAGLVGGGSPDQERVADLLEELLQLRVRAARVEVEEQRRLAAFLTPLERARLYHLKQRLARRALEGRGAGGRPPPP